MERMSGLVLLSSVALFEGLGHHAAGLDSHIFALAKAKPPQALSGQRDSEHVHE